MSIVNALIMYFVYVCLTTFSLKGLLGAKCKKLRISHYVYGPRILYVGEKARRLGLKLFALFLICSMWNFVLVLAVSKEKTLTSLVYFVLTILSLLLARVWNNFDLNPKPKKNAVM